MTEFFFFAGTKAAGAAIFHTVRVERSKDPRRIHRGVRQLWPVVVMGDRNPD